VHKKRTLGIIKILPDAVNHIPSGNFPEKEIF